MGTKGMVLHQMLVRVVLLQTVDQWSNLCGRANCAVSLAPLANTCLGADLCVDPLRCSVDPPNHWQF